MGVCFKRVACLSMDSENERYYQKKAFVGDSVTLFLKEEYFQVSRISGNIRHIGNNKLVIVSNDNQEYSIVFNWINAFNLDYRCQESKYKYGV